jgi:hypothetical protein
VAGRVYSGGWVADREEGRGKLVTADNCAYEVAYIHIRTDIFIHTYIYTHICIHI